MTEERAATTTPPAARRPATNGTASGTEHAAAALVAVAVLRHHRLGRRLLDRLSGLAAVASYTHGSSAGIRSAVASDLAELAAQRGPMVARARCDVARRYRVDAGSCSICPRAWPRAPLPTIARPAMAPAAAAPMVSQSERRRLAVGRHARRYRADHHARRALHRRRKAIARCRHSAATAYSSPTRSLPHADYVRSCRACRPTPGADLRAAQKSSPTIARSVTARRARATARSARPT